MRFLVSSPSFGAGFFRPSFPLMKHTLVAAALIGFSFQAVAQIPDVDMPYTDGCPADTVGATLNCTANDVVVALVTAEDASTKCLTGTTAMLTLDTIFEINAGSERDDVAAWIPAGLELGKNMLLTSANGGPASCTSTAFNFPIYADPDGTGPLVVEDLDGDSCGDVNGVNATFTRPFTDAEVQCEGAVGGAEVDALVSWHLSGNDPTCDAHKEYGDFKKSKCSYSTSFVDLVVVGRLEVCKSADSEQNFTFNIDGGMVWQAGTGADEQPVAAASPFILNPVEVACMSFDVLTHQPGEGGSNVVTITEDSQLLPGDFELSDITCVNNTPGGGPVDFTRDGYSLIIELTEGDQGAEIPTTFGQSDVTCSFINTEGGSLTIQKETLPTGSPQSFNFSQDMDDSGDFSLVDGASRTFDNLNSANDGTYSVTEGVPAGWTLLDVACTDAEAGPLTQGEDFGFAADTLTIDIASGQNVSCTFTNVQEGRAIVRKEVFPVDDATMFTFTGDVAGTIAGGDQFELVIPVPPGTDLDAVEAVPVGWDLVSVACDDGNSVGDAGLATATFNVEPGETVTCVFTNVLRGNIVVTKEAIGDNGVFSFLTNFDGTIQIDTAVNDTVSYNLPASDEADAGTYSVTEDTNGLDRWTYDGSVCTGSEGVEDNDLIDLDPGETVTCVFTNTKWASLTVVKEAYVPDGEFCFEATNPEPLSYVDCLTTVDGHAEGFGDNVMTGTWSIVELPDITGMWMLAHATCDNGDSPGSLNIGPGDDVTCTFVNVPVSPVPVNTMLALLLLVLMVLATGWYFRPAGLRNHRF